MPKILAIFRAFIVFSSALTLIIPGLITSLFSKNWLPVALSMRLFWANMSLSVMGIKLKVDQRPPEVKGAAIYIGNHRSYIDPIVALRHVKALPVAKAEVSSWPIIGYCAKVTGIMWVERENKRSRANTIKAMDKTIESGYSVLVYPEGTTFISPYTQAFKRGAFRLSVERNIPVIPIAIEYENKADAWVGDISFLTHFLNCFGKARTHIRIAYGPPMKGKEAKALMEDTKGWIDERLKEWNAS